MLNFCGIIFLGALQIPLLEVMFVFRFSEGLVVGVFMAIIPEYIRDLMP